MCWTPESSGDRTNNNWLLGPEFSGAYQKEKSIGGEVEVPPPALTPVPDQADPLVQDNCPIQGKAYDEIPLRESKGSL